MWTEARIEELKTLWVDHSASEIAQKFGVSRNAVIGKIHRETFGYMGNRASKPWPEQSLEILRAHWKTHSSSKIVEMLAAIGDQRTAPAVMTQARRLGLSESRADGKRKMPVVKHARVKKNDGGRLANRLRAGTFGKKLSFKPEPIPLPPDALMLSILDLEAGHCRFPLGDPKQSDFGFCGAPREEGKSYCAYHHRLAYQPPESQSRTNSTVRYLMRRAA